MSDGVLIRINTRIYASEDPELYAQLLPLKHRDRSRLVRNLLRAGLGLSPSTKPAPPTPSQATAGSTNAPPSSPIHRAMDKLDHVTTDFGAFQFGTGTTS